MWNMRWWSLAVALLLGAPPALVPAGDGPARPPIPPGPVSESGNYRIGPEDILTVTVWKNDALSVTAPVRPDGMISLPLLQDVFAAGLTPMALGDLLSRKYSEYVANPEVSVVIREVHSPKVSVIGQVVHPGRFELRSRTTVLDVLAQAGGLTEFAARGRIVILRDGPEGSQKVRFNYDKVASDGHANVELRPGDVVLVP